MRNTLNSWTGPVFGAALVMSVGAAFVASAMASEDERKTQPPIGAQAADPSSSPEQGLDIDGIVARLESQGYRDVYEIEHERGRYEVKARNSEGRMVELYVDAESGEVLRSEYDD